MSHYDIVVLSGGGQRGIGELGALQYHWEFSTIVDVKIWAGTSIGSVICLLMVCGYTPQDIFGKVYSISSFFDTKVDTPALDIWNVLSNYGVIDINLFINVIEDMVVKKLGSVPTFLELEKISNKFLIVTGANINLQKAEYFCPKTAPYMSVIDAVRISCNLPVCKKIKYNNYYYSDGGLVDNFPVEIAIHYHNLFSLREPKTLGIVIVNNEVGTSKMEDFTLMTYLYNILMLPMTTMTRIKLKNIDDAIDLVKLSFDDVPIFDINISSVSKMEMWLKGYKEARMRATRELLYIGTSTTADGWDVEW